jgi:hypothetical protein
VLILQIAKLFQGKNHLVDHNGGKGQIKEISIVFPNERFFWDINGLRDPQNLKHISDLTKEHNLNFIALSETGKSEFMRSFLKNLCVGRDFLRRTMAPKGRSGGMLVGVDLQVLDIGAIDEGDYYVKFHLCNKSHSFKWALVVVYGPAQDDEKEGFLAEMVNMCSHEQLPTMIGGDFNILRSSEEKIMTDLIIGGLSFSMLLLMG